MALGDGCWGPEVHWDGENSAAFTGPRAGAWPYGSTCAIDAANGLEIDPAGVVFADPPLALLPYAASWDSSIIGAIPSQDSLMDPGLNYPALLSGVVPGYQIPAPACDRCGIQEMQAATVDVVIGTGSTFGATLRGRQVLSVPNPAAAGPAALADAIGANPMAYLSGLTPGFSDEPWAYTPAGLNSLGGSVVLNGTNQGLLVPVNVAATDYTITAWVKPTADNGGTIMALGGNHTYQWQIVQRTPAGSGQWRLVSSQTDSTTSASTVEGSIAIGTPTAGWYHVALVYTAASNEFALYVNGGATSLAGTFTWAAWAGATALLRLGHVNNHGTIGAYLTGSFTDVMFYRTALADTDVADLYATPAVPTAGATSWWKLADGYKPMRLLRTFQAPVAQLNADNTPPSLLRAPALVLSNAGANRTLMRSWRTGVTGIAYSPVAT